MTSQNDQQYMDYVDNGMFIHGILPQEEIFLDIVSQNNLNVSNKVEETLSKIIDIEKQCFSMQDTIILEKSSEQDTEIL